MVKIKLAGFKKTDATRSNINLTKEKKMKTYDKLQKLRHALEQARQSYMGSMVDPKLWGTLAQNGYASSNNERELYKIAVENNGKDLMYAIESFISKLNREIRSIRSSAKEVKKYRPVEEASRKSIYEIKTVLSNAYVRSRFNVDRATPEFPSGAYSDGDPDSYSFSNDIKVPLTWYRSVFQRGFSMLKATDGIAVPLYVKYRKVFYVEDAGFKAYEVKAIRVRKKVATIEDGYLVIDASHNISEDNPLVDKYGHTAEFVHAYKTDLKSAFKLMNGRTIRDITQKLGA